VTLITFIETACSACHIPPAALVDDVALITLTVGKKKSSCSTGSPSVAADSKKKKKIESTLTAFTLDDPVPNKSVVFFSISEPWVRVLSADWGGDESRPYDNKTSLLGHSVSYSALRWTDLNSSSASK